MSVITQPGATQLTRMPRGPSSAPSELGEGDDRRPWWPRSGCGRARRAGRPWTRRARSCREPRGSMRRAASAQSARTERRGWSRSISSHCGGRHRLDRRALPDAVVRDQDVERGRGASSARATSRSASPSPREVGAAARPPRSPRPRSRPASRAPPPRRARRPTATRAPRRAEQHAHVRGRCRGCAPVTSAVLPAEREHGSEAIRRAGHASRRRRSRDAAVESPRCRSSRSRGSRAAARARSCGGSPRGWAARAVLTPRARRHRDRARRSARCCSTRRAGA